MQHKTPSKNPAIWQDSRANKSKKYVSIFDKTEHNQPTATWQVSRLARIHHLSIPHANLICDLMGGANHG